MVSGALYDASDPELQREVAATQAWLVRYNTAPGAPTAPERHALLAERLAAVGAGTLVRAPFHCDYGFNIRLGAKVFINFNCVILDVAEVTIGDQALIASGVQILAADHPRDEDGRAVAIVDVVDVHGWRPDELAAACASAWAPGWLAWQLVNVRPLPQAPRVPALRKLYSLPLCALALAAK